MMRRAGRSGFLFDMRQVFFETANVRYRAERVPMNLSDPKTLKANVISGSFIPRLFA